MGSSVESTVDGSREGYRMGFATKLVMRLEELGDQGEKRRSAGILPCSLARMVYELPENAWKKAIIVERKVRMEKFVRSTRGRIRSR